LRVFVAFPLPFECSDSITCRLAPAGGRMNCSQTSETCFCFGTLIDLCPPRDQVTPLQLCICRVEYEYAVCICRIEYEIAVVVFAALEKKKARFA
jgi:hypothetical protein